jgi:hypothetical protein
MSIRVNIDILIISDSIRSVTANITRMTEVIKSYVSVPNTLSLRDNFGRIRFIVRLTLINGTKFLPYRQRLFAGNENRLMWAGRDRL